MANNIVQVSDDTFDHEVLQSPLPVLVDPLVRALPGDHPSGGRAGGRIRREAEDCQNERGRQPAHAGALWRAGYPESDPLQRRTRPAADRWCGAEDSPGQSACHRCVSSKGTPGADVQRQAQATMIGNNEEAPERKRGSHGMDHPFTR